MYWYISFWTIHTEAKIWKKSHSVHDYLIVKTSKERIIHDQPQNTNTIGALERVNYKLSGKLDIDIIV